MAGGKRDDIPETETGDDKVADSMTNELIKLDLELLDKSNKELCNEIYSFFKTIPQG